jgi:hypothetical protein
MFLQQQQGHHSACACAGEFLAVLLNTRSHQEMHMLVVKEQSALVLKYLVLLSAPRAPLSPLTTDCMWHHVLAAPWPDGVTSPPSHLAPTVLYRPCLRCARRCCA